jgi:uncharacterized protein YndB with AHSA1/START domain
MLTKNEHATRQGADKLIVSRLLNAPRELVFDVWTDPEHIKHWWGPNGFTNTISKMDVRPGGEWDFVMHGPDGTDYKNTHIFKEIVRPERIVMEHATGPKFLMVATFEDQGGKTLLTIESRFESAEQLEQVIKTFKADEGLKQNVDRLEAYVAKMSIVIERTFRAPAEKVWKAISDRDEMKKWYFDLAAFRPEVGFEFEFEGGPDDRKYLHKCRVTDVVAGKRLAYSWRYDGYEGISYVTFELFDEGAATRLRLTHTGLDTFPAIADFAKSNFVAGWTSLIGRSLKEYVEGAIV